MVNNARVMIVEDSPTVRYEVRIILKNIGIDLIEVANEVGMYMKIEEYGKTVDLIIMDITLQFENGLDLVEKLKSIEKYRNIPILMLTEHADVNNVLKAKDLGVIGYLRKPIHSEEFSGKVCSILGIEREKKNTIQN